MYYKGHNMLHTIRQIVDNDSTWKEILRGINRDFRHQIVTADQIERYIIEQSGKDLDDLFDQYLHYSAIPVFQYYIDDLNRLHYRWKADISHFNMPLKIAENKGDYYFIYPVSHRWKIVKLNKGKNFNIDPNFYIDTERISNKESDKGNN